MLIKNVRYASTTGSQTEPDPNVSVYQDFPGDLPETVENSADNVDNVSNGDVEKEVVKVLKIL